MSFVCCSIVCLPVAQPGKNFGGCLVGGGVGVAQDTGGGIFFTNLLRFGTNRASKTDFRISGGGGQVPFPDPSFLHPWGVECILKLIMYLTFRITTN